MTTIELEQSKESISTIPREQLVLGICVAASLENNGIMGLELSDDQAYDQDVDEDSEVARVIKLKVDEPEIIIRSLRRAGIYKRGVDQFEPEEAIALREILDEGKHFAEEGLIKGIPVEDFDMVDQHILARAA